MRHASIDISTTKLIATWTLAACLMAAVVVQMANSDCVAEFTLSAGQSADFVLEPAAVRSS
jgi:hypothetical protein